MRRRSIKSISDVRVSTAVVLKVRLRGFFDLTGLLLSSRSAHSTKRSTCTGFFPPSECTSNSLISSVYRGNSDNEERRSRPNGERRLSNCEDHIRTRQGYARILSYSLYAEGVLLPQVFKGRNPPLGQNLNTPMSIVPA